MKTRRHNLKQRLVSEAIGTGFLVAAVVDSGIMGERLAGGNGAVALLVNTIATGAALVALICTFGPISGAHLNPAVSLADAIEGGITLPEMIAYIATQCTGGIGGTIAAHLMFDLPWCSTSAHARNGSALLFSEFVASFGLLCVIWGCSRLRSGVVPFAVASYITAAYSIPRTLRLECSKRRLGTSSPANCPPVRRKPPIRCRQDRAPRFCPAARSSNRSSFRRG